MRASTQTRAPFLAIGAAAIAASALLACGDESANSAGDEAEIAVMVSVRPLGEVSETVSGSAPGRILSLNDSLISAEVSARVKSIEHRRGDSVIKGAVLIELDCDLYNYRLSGAKARLGIAESDRDTQAKDYKRHQELFEEGLISEEAYLAKQNAAERAKGNADLARSELKVAQRDVGNCSVRAPFDAAVMEVFPAVGELLQPGAQLARLLDVSSVEVWADLNPLYAKNLSPGSRAKFVQNRNEIDIELISKSLTPDLSSGNYKTRFRILNENLALSGSGEVVWQTTEKFLDSEFLREAGGEYGIMAAQGDRAAFIAIPGAREGWFIPVAGLDPNTQLIIRGRARVKDGDLLAIRDPVADAAPQSAAPSQEASRQ